jgi:hypothetical protein
MRLGSQPARCQNVWPRRHEVKASFADANALWLLLFLNLEQKTVLWQIKSSHRFYKNKQKEQKYT